MLSPRTEEVLHRLDHANIYLIIAGTYTPFALLALDGQAGAVVLGVIWAGAIAGVLFRVLWVGAPRWLSTALYIGLGWTAVFVLPQLVAGAGVVAVALLFLGGVLYTVGGVVYAMKRPDPSPGGSAFTRSSTPSPSPPTWCSTWRSPWWSTRRRNVPR